MYGIYFEFERVARAERITVLPSGALEARGSDGAVKFIMAPGSWDHVAQIPEEGE